MQVKSKLLAQAPYLPTVALLLLPALLMNCLPSGTFTLLQPKFSFVFEQTWRTGTNCRWKDQLVGC